MKTLEEKIKIMSAALAGAKIEVSDMGAWHPVDSPTWNWCDFDYRIKPENKQVPYDFSDAESLIGRKFRAKDGRFYLFSTHISKTTIYFGNSSFSYLSAMTDLEIWNNTLNRWESCTKTIKG